MSRGNNWLFYILEHEKFDEFQERELIIERFVSSDCHLLHIETNQLIVDDANPLTLWFA